MRTLGIDFGERRIGLAISDEEGRVAVPVWAAYAIVRPSCSPKPQSIPGPGLVPESVPPPVRAPLLGVRWVKYASKYAWARGR